MTKDSPPAPSELKPITSRQLTGHLGHLTKEQETTLKEFQIKLKEGGYYSPAEGNNEASHDDVTLVRFLRARKFDLEGAYQQFTSAETWRKENHVDELYDSFSLQEFDQAAKLYPQWTGRRDKSGLPVYVFKVSCLGKKETDEYSKNPERLNPRMIALYEHMVQFVLPFCSAIPHAHEEVPISGCATIVDISNVSLMRFWQLKSHMQRASALASANYAETLGAIYLVGAPNFFSTVWGWVKNWFDPGTVEKIFILPSHSVLATLSTHIDPASIPEEFGGSLPWSYGHHSRPNLDSEAKEMLGLDQVPEGPIRWFGKERGCELRGTGRDRKEEEKIEQGLESRRESRRNSPMNGAANGESPKESIKSNGGGDGGFETPMSSVGASNTSSVPTTPKMNEESTTTTTTTSEGTAPTTALNLSAEASKELLSNAPPPVGMAGSDLLNKVNPPTTTEANGEAQHEEQQHDISVAARENPSAPIKDLAATLEGTTL